MKASGLFTEKGNTALIVLVAVALVTVVALQVSSLIQNQKTPLSTTNVISQNQPVNTIETSTQTDNIKKYLIAEAALLGVTDNISLYFKDMQNSSLEVSLDPTKSWVPASTIKAYVLLEAFRQKRLGLVDFNQTITIKPDNVVTTELETDEFPRLREGTTTTVRQLVESMIIQSDNTAYNSLLDILDRRNINNSLRTIGITETVVGEKLNLDGDQFQKDLAVAGRQPNTTTVKDLATYFSLLYTNQIPDAPEMLAIFKRQKINNMIPAKLPENISVAHKTGDWAPIYHDGGIIYKPADPFVFVAFTNSGDPAIVAKLAQLAYYQDPKYIGKATAQVKSHPIALRPIYYNQPSNSVLGESIDNKFPNITAEDLGITSKDLIPDSRQIKAVKSALVTPGSFFYNLKKTAETAQLQLSFTNSQKANTYIDLANSRLSEINSLLSKGEVDKTDLLLTEAVSDIKNALDLAKNDPQKDQLLIEIKKTHDLYYAVMAERATSLPDEKKSQFVDSVYNFYQKGKQDISPAINSSVIVSPTEQKPTIGVIQNITPSQMTLKFEDGSTKQVNLSTGTNVRSVDQETSEDSSSLKVGKKIAVLGPSGSNNTINAQFVLNDIPQGLTDQHQGTVTEINPSKGTIKVIDQNGQVNLVSVSDNTALKSRDTNVSLEGIKAGSKVVVFGIPTSVESTPSASATVNTSTAAGKPTTSNNPNNQSPKPAGSALPHASSKSNQSIVAPAPTPNSSSKPVIGIKATSVTIVGNSSGKDEKKQPVTTPTPAKPGTSAPASNPAPQKPATNNTPPVAPTTNTTGSQDTKKDSKK